VLSNQALEVDELWETLSPTPRATLTRCSYGTVGNSSNAMTTSETWRRPVRKKVNFGDDGGIAKLLQRLLSFLQSANFLKQIETPCVGLRGHGLWVHLTFTIK
jgi:hypothetical protein